MRTTAWIMAIVAVLAGCIAPADDAVEPNATTTDTSVFVPDAPEFDWKSVVDTDHANHQVPMLHTGGHGIGLVGHASIASVLPTASRGSITQVDVQGDFAVVSGMEGGLAFAIVDISDPASPKAVSSWPSAAQGWTARFSDDGAYVFYGCQMLNNAPYVSTTWAIGTCEDPRAPHLPGGNPAGVVVIDVQDKANPKFVTFTPTAGSHNIFVTTINGVDTVFTSAVTILTFDREVGKLTEIAAVPGVHDATVGKHPITGDWLLYTGAGELSIYNVNDPGNPEIVYEGGGGAVTGFVGWHEQTLIPGIVDGRVILALGGESFSSTGGVPDRVAFVDITDPTNVTLLSIWTPPFADSVVPWVSYLYSVHEMAATPTGQLAIAWYHAGVWVLDVSTQARQAEPVVLGAYLPNKLPNVVPSTFAQTPAPVVPFVWGVGWDMRGYLVVPDMHTGLYVMEPAWGLIPAVDGGQ